MADWIASVIDLARFAPPPPTIQHSPLLRAAIRYYTRPPHPPSRREAAGTKLKERFSVRLVGSTGGHQLAANCCNDCILPGTPRCSSPARWLSWALCFKSALVR